MCLYSLRSLCFSMEGSVCKLPEIVKLKKKYKVHIRESVDSLCRDETDTPMA